jgi:dTDP-4-amino-4,6-dideoxygalactose transaminase
LKKIPFNLAYLTGSEEAYVLEALRSHAHCGNRVYGEKCVSLLKEKYGFGSVFLTPSCTAAMEMGAILSDLTVGDEVILPSYTFSSTANAIVLRGAKPVFCDVDPRTMNIDPNLIEDLITDKTKMILPIDYAGIPCEINSINSIAERNCIMVMLDAAQSLHSNYKNQPCGTHTPLAAFSFHESKNLSCGEGGALIINDPELAERAVFLQEKGTDRSLVLQGLKTKYGWVDLGSSFLLSDILAAMLLAQIENVNEIVKKRAVITSAYQELFGLYEKRGNLQIPHPPPYVQVNHHAYFVIFDTAENRNSFLALTRQRGITPYSGYVPLHSSKMGVKFGYATEDLPITEDIAKRIVRLPFYTDLADNGLEYCTDGMRAVLEELYGNII